MASSVRKTNNELKRLNGDIRFNISRLRAASNRVIALAARQAPIGFRATLSGTSGGGAKRRAKKARKPVVRKVRRTRKKTSKKK